MLLLFLMFGNTNYGQNLTNKDDVSVSQFQTPGLASGPYVWWHWMGYNITKSGIIKDLESMKEAGIAGATMFQIKSSGSSGCEPFNNSYSSFGFELKSCKAADADLYSASF